jgi:hypothetical protein
MLMREILAQATFAATLFSSFHVAAQNQPYSPPPSNGAWPGAPPPPSPASPQGTTGQPLSPSAYAGPPPLAPPTPEAQATPVEPKFGDAGEFVISGLMSASVGHLGYSSSDASTTSASFQPAFDYFVQPNFSLGASLFINYSDATSAIGIESKTVSYGAYGRLGANAPLGDSISFRPIASLGVWSLHSTLESQFDGVTSFGGTAVPAAGEVTETAVVLEFFAPLLVHPARHFFLGLGPDIYTDLTHTVGDFANRRTFIGLSSIVGGWF